MDAIVKSVELRTIEYKPDGSVTFKFTNGDIGSASDSDAIEFATNTFNDIDKLLKALLILNYYEYAEIEKTAIATNIAVDNWIVKNGPS
jgi:hypothetical protein